MASPAGISNGFLSLAADSREEQQNRNSAVATARRVASGRPGECVSMVGRRDGSRLAGPRAHRKKPPEEFGNNFSWALWRPLSFGFGDRQRPRFFSMRAPFRGV